MHPTTRRADRPTDQKVSSTSIRGGCSTRPGNSSRCAPAPIGAAGIRRTAHQRPSRCESVRPVIRLCAERTLLDREADRAGRRWRRARFGSRRFRRRFRRWLRCGLGGCRAGWRGRRARRPGWAGHRGGARGWCGLSRLGHGQCERGRRCLRSLWSAFEPTAYKPDRWDDAAAEQDDRSHNHQHDAERTFQERHETTLGRPRLRGMHSCDATNRTLPKQSNIWFDRYACQASYGRASLGNIVRSGASFRQRKR